MSRLASRLRRLEERLGSCPTCNGSPTPIYLQAPNGRRSPKRSEHDRPCPDCGHTPEAITVRLSFDPNPDPDTDTETEAGA